MNINIVFGTDDGKKLKGDNHVGNSEYFAVYNLSEDRVEFIEQRKNPKYEENKTETHGDPQKAKTVSSILKGIDVIVGQRFGPNITRLRNKFLCVIIRVPLIEQAIEVMKENINEIVEEINKEERMGIVLS